MTSIINRIQAADLLKKELDLEMDDMGSVLISRGYSELHIECRSDWREQAERTPVEGNPERERWKRTYYVKCAIKPHTNWEGLDVQQARLLSAELLNFAVLVEKIEALFANIEVADLFEGYIRPEMDTEYFYRADSPEDMAKKIEKMSGSEIKDMANELGYSYSGTKAKMAKKIGQVLWERRDHDLIARWRRSQEEPVWLNS